MLWYLPVSPWSWSSTFACMISVRSNRGRHKLVSEPTACRIPLSNSLAEVESSLWKTILLTWLCGLRAHVANWVVLGSFIPLPYSGILISRLFGLNILLTLTLGSRIHFLPEISDIIDDCLLRQKILQILLYVSWDIVSTALQFLTTDKSPWITSLPFVPSSPVALVC